QDDTFGKLRPFEIDHYPAPLIINQTYQTSTKSVKLKNFATEPFAAGLAKEWASLPVLRDIEIRGETIKRGESYYGKTGMNVARIAPRELESALKSMRSLTKEYVL
ncbi:hypothetical protein ACFQ3K_16710, partial [Brucella gallinifaecis]